MKSKGNRKLTRRRLLTTGAGLAVGTALGTGDPMAADETVRPNVYEALGVKRVINAIGTVTFLGGSVMPPEVVAAWAEASRHFVNLSDLHDKVGARIAKLIGVEAALVTTGAAGALLLATAGVVTRGQPARIRRLPDTTGMKNEVILQKTHHSVYDNQLTDVGVKLIEVETAEDVKRAVNERTALMFYMNFAAADGRISRQEWIELGRRHGVPTLLDAAADVPPLEHLSEYNRTGFDLVAFSGGKALRGPNDTGLLLGPKDLIEAAKKNTNPHGGTIGRMMKVSKEDMIACLAAVERFVRRGPDAERRDCERRLETIEAVLKELPLLQTERIVPPVANHVPHLIVSWDEKRLRLTPAQVTRRLMQGEPPIQIGRVHGTGDKGIVISVLTLQDGEDKVVAECLRAILGKAT